MDWFVEGRFELEWRLGCMDLLDHMEWVEALLLVHTKDDLDHKSLWVMESTQTKGGKDLIREEAFQNRRFLHFPSENLP